jgi:RNA recognition motif-containing protein
MADASAESKAISDLQDVEWMGRSIRVNKAEPRPTPAFGNSRW